MNWSKAQQKELLTVIQRRNERAILERQLSQTKTELANRQEDRMSSASNGKMTSRR